MYTRSNLLEVYTTEVNKNKAKDYIISKNPPDCPKPNPNCLELAMLPVTTKWRKRPVVAFVEQVYGKEEAKKIAVEMEYERHEDPSWDPFAELYKLPKDEE
ncbi:hypothetical protein C8R42DRAFT_711563 [Lentinula raphanica]|nr:hypothetical protein C8R42DRAFT_711563 [Lentinula raphanica]